MTPNLPLVGALDESGNAKRLGVLTDALPDVSALMLASFSGTHLDVFTFDDLVEGLHHGIRCVSAAFTHKPTGRQYIVAVCSFPPEADGREFSRTQET